MDSVISNFEYRNPSASIAERITDKSNIVRIRPCLYVAQSSNIIRTNLIQGPASN